MSLSIIGNGFIGGFVSNKLNFLGIKHFLYTSKSFNLCDENTWKSLSTKTTQVFIAAGSMSSDENELQSVNHRPIKLLCKYLEDIGVKKVVFLSSGAVYGDYPYDTHPVIECKPSSIYGLSKLNAENSLLSSWGGALNIVRLYFTYGPHQKKPRLIPNLIDRIQKKEPILINNDGGPKITLNHVDDVSQHLINTFIVNNHETIIQNLASPFNISIKDLATQLATYIGTKPIFKFNNINEPNHTSLPFPDMWPKSGLLEDIFHAL
ncbi:dTDP-D-glucose 4,6-dehydratase [Holospora obtusa F1]|uniref:dTDP-D-glucose 4,6-dehydratase n=1 Tax=Holospora obtusa F1 TaxID=1399147 RepID=W6TE23_HOLOB|nr:NAD(P)-dependent oxidoreductase [Holospora obtusa]ETZ07146.1 dTDP-D-glucose 4,6-dehydratase [Holospora obtusa F1]